MTRNTGQMFKKELERAIEARRVHLCTKKSKRYRSAFTTDQINYLENEFKKFPYIVNSKRTEVANALNIPERAVKIWFQNRRMKEKKDVIHKNYNDDDQTNSTVFVNDQHNNTITSQSTNETYSLSLKTTRNSAVKSNPVNNKIETGVPIKLPELQSKSEMHREEIKSKYFKDTIFNSDPPMRSSISPISSCSSVSSPEIREVAPKMPIHFGQPIKTEPQIEAPLIQNDIPNKQYNKEPPELQELPQDLSSRKANRVLHQQQPSPNMDGYVPLYYQNYYPQSYMPAGNIFWNPVNGMPLVSGSSPVMVPNSHPGPVPVSPATKCHCDCHLKSSIPYSAIPQRGDTQFQGQYVIAIPLNNNKI